MERKEFRQRLKKLFAWALVMMLLLNGMQGGLVWIYAEETGMTGKTIAVNYYDSYQDTAMLMTSTTASSEGAIITSYDYTTEVAVATDATIISGVVLPTVEKEGYFFVDWGLGISGGYDTESQSWLLGDGWTAEVLDELPLVAYFQEVLKSEIIYTFQGGTMDGVTDTSSYTVTQPDADTAQFEEAITTSIPTQTGMIFTGWQMDATDTSRYDAEAGIIYGTYGENCTLYANWRDENLINIEYLISDDFAGIGEISEADAKITYYESEVEAPVKVTTPEVTILNENWFFEGWLCQELADMPATTFEVYYPECGVSEEDGSLIGGQSVTYTMNAQFVQAAELTVVYDSNNGTETTTETIVQSSIDETDATITLPAAPVNDTYIFAGWLCDADDTLYEAGAEVSCDYGIGSATFTAQWRPENTITITTAFASGFENAGTMEDGLADIYYESDNNADNGCALIIIPEMQDVKDEYLFVGWKCYDASGAEYIEDYIYSEDYMGTGISCYSPGVGLQIAYPTDENNVGGNNASYVLEAQFINAAAVTVIYDANGGSGLNIITDTAYQKEINEEWVFVTLPAALTREGYEFTGWLSSEDNALCAAGELYTISITTQAVTYTAQWQEKEYTIPVTYNTDGGTISSTDYTQEVNLWASASTAEGVELPTVEKEGYFFDYWKLEINEDAVYDAGIQSLTWGADTPAYTLSELLLTAHWTGIAKSTITYNLDGGTWNDSEEAPAQELIQPDKNTTTFSKSVMEGEPEKSGYAFVGWTMEATDTSGYDEESGLITGVYGTDYTLTALWEEMIGAGTQSLQAGVRYRLAAGNWQINGDSTIYTGGGYFYVPEDGDYTFTEV